jgi:hypothetical protein
MSVAVFMLLFWLGFERFDSSRYIRFHAVPVKGMSKFF